MQNKRKTRLILGIGGLFIATIVGIFVLLTIRFMDGGKQPTTRPLSSETTKSHEILESTENASPEGTYFSTSDSLPTSVSSESEAEATTRIKKFFSVYFTWELDDKSVTDRAELLKEFMSEELYTQKNIEADSEMFKELLQIYQETKEINTTNSIQLVSSRYLSSKIYQDTTDTQLYKVMVTFEQKAPYQDAAFMSEKSFTLRLSDNKITKIAEGSEQIRSESSESE